jgi:chromosome segregation ATPase
MAVPAARFDVEHSMEVEARLARLEDRTETIQRDVAEIKADQRRLDAKIEAKFDAVNARIDGLDAKLDAKIDGVNAKIDTKIDAVNKRIDGVKDSISALAEKVASFDGKLSALEASMIKWIIGTIITSMALAFGIAKFVS